MGGVNRVSDVVYPAPVGRRDRVKRTGRLQFRECAVVGAILISQALSAQERSVAITVDDLPYASGNLKVVNVPEARARAGEVNRKLLTAFRAHRVPVTGFVIQKTVDSLGAEAGARILGEWIKGGFDLGNHSYSHPDINTLSTVQIEQEIVHGEATIGPLMARSGKKLSFFRFPMNHTGDTKEKHDVIAAFLTARGYQLATCTIESSDYIFNQAYVRMLMTHDVVAAEKLRNAYLTYTSTEIEYYSALSVEVFGYEPPQVMLLHDNQLNADVIDKVLELFEQKHYRFVNLETAQADAAYRTPDTYITEFGPMWGYRWAKEKGISVNGSLEADPPKWIVEYGKIGGTPVP
jgi:peptidoglycan/xylan/chitin deacetylase (PgdA/CDA1 family)